VATDLQRLGMTSGRLGRVHRGCAGMRVHGSGSLELAWLAAGRVDAWLQFETAEWDWLPGALLVDEAGGASRRVDDAEGAWFVAGNRTNCAEIVG
jgi:fructose-1,6-bisphosphatase/inositol monophosphatase family enzyme